MQRDSTCACAVACLHPHNSITNVVVSLTIHDNMLIYEGLPGWDGSGTVQLMKVSGRAWETVRTASRHR